MAGRGVGERGKGGVTAVRLYAGDPGHTHTLASALRIRTPHSVEILAIDGATIDPDDAHAPLSRPPGVFYKEIF